MTDHVAKLLARVTAGAPQNMGTGGSGAIETVNKVMGALGMGRAGRPGTLILMANYCEDDSCRRWAEQWLVRYAWIGWLKTADPSVSVSTGQMARLVSVALGQHIDPEAGRRTGVKVMAKLIGMNHQTFRIKFRDHFQRIKVEITTQENMAIAALVEHYG